MKTILWSSSIGKKARGWPSIFRKVFWANGDERWKTERDFRSSWSMPKVATIDGREEVILAAEPKVVSYDLKSGKELWYDDADDGFYASPILADGRIHLLERNGTMHILKPGRELKILGQSHLGEDASCTPAVVGDSFYIRGLKHLFRIGPRSKWTWKTRSCDSGCFCKPRRV